MQYTLLSRFQGVLLGAAIGEILGANCNNHASFAERKPWTDVNRWGFKLVPQDAPMISGGKIALEGIRRITDGSVCLGSAFSPSAYASLSLSSASPSPALLKSAENQGQFAAVAIATLPLTLFYHDDPQQRRTHIRQILEHWRHPDDAYWIISLIGDIFALALQGKLVPSEVIPQLLAASAADPSPALLDQQYQQLSQIQAWLEQSPRQPFHAFAEAWLTFLARTSPSARLPVDCAIALAAFLATPEDARLALLRVAQLQHQPQTVCALTGALLGAYNGKAGLPLDWRKSLRDTPDYRSPLSPLWDVRSETELLEYVQLLLATWSGIYHPMSNVQSSALSTFDFSTIVAAPRVIRPR